MKELGTPQPTIARGCQNILQSGIKVFRIRLMALVIIKTNTFVDEAYVEGLLSAMSQHISRSLGRNEDRIMVSLEDQGKLMQGGSLEPCAYVEVRNLDLDHEDLTPLANAMAQDVQQYLRIPPERIRVQYLGVTDSMWSWHNNEFSVYAPRQQSDYRDF
jgi:2C-methyl-D-erythritol 2,4-cyclodiphosphate synthase